jgi:hypothetical protein
MEIYRTSTIEEKTQSMDTSPPPADTQETTEHQTEKLVSAASTDSFSPPKKYTEFHDKSQAKITTPNFALKIQSRFFRPNTTTTSETSTTRKGKNESPPSYHYIKIDYFNVLEDLRQVITVDISTTYVQRGIRFYFSSEQDLNIGLNYLKLNKIEYCNCQIAENKATRLRGLSPEVRQLRRTT